MCCAIFGIVVCLIAGNVEAQDASVSTTVISATESNATEISTTEISATEISANSTPETAKLLVADQNVEYRPLTVGDTFTPSEMLPVAEKLIKKSGSLSGAGKGVVSSAPTPQHLAEKLFQGFFFTTNHIVTLKHLDIVGLDALQALALSGDPLNADFGNDFIASTIYKQKDQIERLQKVNCTYMLLKKKADDKADKLIMRRALKIAEKLGKKRQLKVHPPRKPGRKHRRGLKIAEKLGKKRQLKVHPPKNGKKHRRGSRRQNLNDTENLNRTESPGPSSSLPPGLRTDATPKLLDSMKVTNTQSSNHLNNLGQSTSVQNTTPKVVADFTPVPTTDTRTMNEKLKFNSSCHYTYECKRPSDMDSCRLYLSCDKRDHEEGIHIKHLEDEHETNIKEFRKMLGINLYDEEVEKIIERRFMSISPQKYPHDPKARDQSLQKIKDLEKIFARVMNGANTAPMAPTTEPNRIKKS